MEQVDLSGSHLPKPPGVSEFPFKVEVELSDDIPAESLKVGNAMNYSSDASVKAAKIEIEIQNDFSAVEIEHISLKERLQILRSRNLFGLAQPVSMDQSIGVTNPEVEDTTHHSDGIGKQERRTTKRNSYKNGNSLCSYLEINASDACTTSEFSSCNGNFIGARNLEKQEENASMCATREICTEVSVSGRKELFPINPNDIHRSSFSTAVKVKDESLENNDLKSYVNDAVEKSPFSALLSSIKSEVQVYDDLYEDELDHMLLRDRMKLLGKGKLPDVNIAGNLNCLSKFVTSDLEHIPNVSESAKCRRVGHPRKRRKTATDSVETALEEDAPGLLQVLIDKGVTTDEIKLYGETDSGNIIDESLPEDSFSELEAVISKLFFQRTTLLKFPPLRCTQASKTMYCLDCLISLVEQTRYLQFRKWPVEWGWCRDLQSFIFVFERHNRIVLERPEYGYATYFFELVVSLPIDWQIKRLVIAMKLTSCSRVALIENKALMVGEDLTEGEARVLMEYGWTPNSGLATMLNYCDRVVHDRKNEKERSEWRSKIGKLLMNGYNGGAMVSNNIPKKAIGYTDSQSPQIKLEF